MSSQAGQWKILFLKSEAQNPKSETNSKLFGFNYLDLDIFRYLNNVLDFGILISGLFS